VILVDTPTSSREVREEIFAGLQKRIEQEKARVLELPRRGVQWWHAAAAVLLLAAGIAFYRSLSVPGKKEGLSYAARVAGEVTAPQTARAVITLAGGQKLYLDSIPEGTIAREGNTRVTKKADGVVYESPTDAKEVGYNVLTVPRGSRVVHLTLSDGSRVWLNAESSMRYPVAFTGSSRNVEITGEAYLVTANAAMPFRVTGKGMTVEVLGTSFNINVYDDEPLMRTTLSEGKIKVAGDRNSQLLAPGEQAQCSPGGEIKLEKDIDMEKTMAWKNNQFIFERDDLPAILRQLGRWYDVEILYQGSPKPYHFSGIISRARNASDVLRMLEATGNIHFDIKGKKIIVKP